MDEKLKAYPKTDKFECVNTIGVPHPYCITPKHVTYAADNCNGMLTKESIQDAEEHGAKCGTCRGDLSYDEHEQAVVVKVLSGEELEDIKEELEVYLKSFVKQVEDDGFKGFAFTK